MSLAIEAALKSKYTKLNILETLRIKTGVIQNLVRVENEVGILDLNSYVRISGQLVEISKMTNGWINFITEKGSHFAKDPFV